ncbi:MAG: FAD-dependent oxidoreductase [Hyphomonadaceae bacterium]|nr:FAD-dependent oxidoreductase [Hyphomonadaceae bacterium]
MSSDPHILIIGAGQAGAETAWRLRGGGFVGKVTLVGDEPLEPYQRPPLSKAFLAGKVSRADLVFRGADAYAQMQIRLLSETRVEDIDRSARIARLLGDEALRYDVLVLATGARPRRLPVVGADLPGVHMFRTAADVDAIRPSFRPGAKLVVIGAGYIGLEVAAVARQCGLDVTVVEAAARPLARVTSPEIASFFLSEHSAKGVRFALGAQVASIRGHEHATGVTLTDGAELPADVVIAGVGVTPEVSLAQRCGLTIDDGIVTDANCRTEDPSVFAIGDCASRPMRHYDNRMVRLESVHNAIEGAKLVAASILGQNPPVLEAPWFWSDQYDLKLQIAGLFQGYDRVVLRGDPRDRAFAVFYFKQERMIAVDAVNKPGEFLGAKALLQKGLSPSPEVLADMTKPMKEIVATAG